MKHYIYKHYTCIIFKIIIQYIYLKYGFYFQFQQTLFVTENNN